MDIKSKSKRYIALALLAFVLTTTIIALAVADIYDDRRYLDKDYFLNQHSYQITDELAIFAKLLKEVHVDYADYADKTPQQKVDGDLLHDLSTERDQKLSQLEEHLSAQYNTRIEEARAAGNDSQAALLTTERENKRTNAVKQIQTDYETKVKEVASARDKKYEDMKFNLLLRDGTFKYAIQDKKNNKVYTNLDYEPTEAEIRQNAIISVQLPQRKGERSWGLSRFFQENQWEGIIYIPRVAESYSPAFARSEASSEAVIDGYYHRIIDDATYYQSIRERLLKEIGLLIVCVIGAIVLFRYLKQNQALEHPFVTKSQSLLRRIPLDIRLLSLLPAGVIYLVDTFNAYFFSLPIGLDHFLTLALLSPLTAYFLLYVVEAWSIYKNPESLSQQWQNSLYMKVFSLLRDSFADRGMFFKLVILLGLTIGMCVSAGVGLLALMKSEPIFLFLAFLYSVFYVMFVLPYILRRTALLNRITRGVEQMSAGNFDVVIDAGKTKGKLASTAHALNNLKQGVKQSLDDQMKSERLKSELITNVSHDLKTPLTSIINYVDLLKREDLSPDERKNYLDVLERKTDRLKVLIDDLFEAAKMASGSVELNIEQVNVAALLKQTLAECDDKIEQSSLTFRVNIEQNKIYAPLDGKKTWRVFENLISNAIKYSLPNTRVHVDLIELPDKVQLTIKNVSAYEINFDADELFERFKRADESRNTEGSGLGLAIAKSIVELQGGNLSIDIDGDYFKVIVVFHKYKPS